jgi:uncharacterized protein YndB with AHSA1/START domain
VYPFDNRVVVTQHSNQEVVMERSIEIDAGPEEIWEAISTPEGREAWLDDDREVHVEAVEEPSRLVWWWAGEEQWTRVEVTLVPLVSTTRVLVRETAPSFPLTAVARAFACV